MPCYHPLPAWYSKERNASGKRAIVFKIAEAYTDRPLSLPCGRCIGCRLEYARQWAVRCMHEASLWDSNCFLTLTYSDAYLPQNGSLRPRDVVLFLKRLRKQYGAGIRFFQCGEYGEQLARPHHHMLLFNHRFGDAVRVRDSVGTNGTGDALYSSAELSRLWPWGFAGIGEVTFQSAGYVARYSLKKVRGPDADWHYSGRVPEYLTMSRRPGIGSTWIHRFAADVYPSDELIVNGKVTRPPRYYDNAMTKFRPEAIVKSYLDKQMLSRIKTRRRGRAYGDPDSTGKRLLVREAVKVSAVKFLSRKFEGSDDS
ncbi:MAG: replication initiator protein [Microviridae sp.]|nr:MAG: replication initiator protein [Microviridae sp.]